MVTVNVVASSMFFCYCLFYLLFADPKVFFSQSCHIPLAQKDFTVKFTIVITLIVAMLFWVEYAPNLDYLGVVCMTFNIINFGAPLAGLVCSFVFFSRDPYFTGRRVKKAML